MIPRWPLSLSLVCVCVFHMNGRRNGCIIIQLDRIRERLEFGQGQVKLIVIHKAKDLQRKETRQSMTTIQGNHKSSNNPFIHWLLTMKRGKNGPRDNSRVNPTIHQFIPFFGSFSYLSEFLSNCIVVLHHRPHESRRGQTIIQGSCMTQRKEKRRRNIK